MNLPDRLSSLATPGATAEVLRRFGIRPRRRFGQHFLISQRALDVIVESADLSPADSVLEVGAGIGTLTIALAERAGRVTAVEVDESLIPALRMTVGHRPNVRIVAGDILHLDMNALFADGVRRKVVANLPFNVASLLIVKLLELPLGLSRLVLTVQREVADRLAASPGTEDYGALSVAVQYRAAVSVMGRVPATAFHPPPEVESAIVRIDVRPQPSVTVRDERLFFAVVRAAFGQRRKTLRNALTALGIEPEEAAEACRAADIDPGRRGETLSLQEFATLARYVRGNARQQRKESKASPR
jgi:16S rRNA (adenine1518-N6/adenine1519-N6)-dimethyltransferase